MAEPSENERPTVGELVSREARRISMEQTAQELQTSIENIAMDWYPAAKVSTRFDLDSQMFVVDIKFPVAHHQSRKKKTIEQKLYFTDEEITRWTGSTAAWKKHVYDRMITVRNNFTQTMRKDDLYYDGPLPGLRSGLTHTPRPGGWTEVNYDLSQLSKFSTDTREASERLRQVASRLQEHLNGQDIPAAIDSIKESARRRGSDQD